jgi:hypothetical protein
MGHHPGNAFVQIASFRSDHIKKHHQGMLLLITLVHSFYAWCITGTLERHSHPGDLSKTANLYEDLLALRPEGASGHVHFAQARAFLANINVER